MNFANTPLEFDLHIGPQISIDDLEHLQSEGYRTIICLRPDYEDSCQPTAAELSEKSKSLGLDFHHLPCTFDQIGFDEAAAFKVLRDECETPVFAFCKSGMRAAGLWAIERAAKSGWQTTTQIANEFCYNLERLHDRLANLGSSH